jgi:hypothetical protein
MLLSWLAVKREFRRIRQLAYSHHISSLETGLSTGADGVEYGAKGSNYHTLSCLAEYTEFWTCQG